MVNHHYFNITFRRIVPQSKLRLNLRVEIKQKWEKRLYKKPAKTIMLLLFLTNPFHLAFLCIQKSMKKNIRCAWLRRRKIPYNAVGKSMHSHAYLLAQTLKMCVGKVKKKTYDTIYRFHHIYGKDLPSELGIIGVKILPSKGLPG